MAKILWIATGGTIACIKTEIGHNPITNNKPFNNFISTLDTIGGRNTEIKTIYNIDSSDSEPFHWQILANEIYNHYNNYDGFLITHGTDTLQYTSAALSLMLPNISKPIVLTGSQIPLEYENTDGYQNLKHAFSLVNSLKSGVWVVFGGRIIDGFSVYKFHSKDFDAFRSVRNISFNINEADIINSQIENTDFPFELKDNLCEDVFLLKITPNITTSILNYILNNNFKGVVCEGFGLGGIPSVRENFLFELGQLVKKGIRVIYVSSCPEGGSDLSIYTGGVKAKALGIEDWGYLTPSAALIKLMWELAD